VDKKMQKKVKGFYTCIDSICAKVERENQQCRHDSIAISITSVDLNRLIDSSFMYTQLLKEILLQMKYDDAAKKQLTEFCREYYFNNP